MNHQRIYKLSTKSNLPTASDNISVSYPRLDASSQTINKCSLLQDQQTNLLLYETILDEMGLKIV